MKKIIPIYIMIAVLFMAVIYLFIDSPEKSKHNKVGYVKSQVLIYQCDGFAEAQELFEIASTVLNKKMDSLNFIYQNSLTAYQQNFASYTDSEKLKMETVLQSQYDNVLYQSQNIEAEIQQMENQMLEGVLNQVNHFSQEFAKKEGIDILLGTTNAGNLLYGIESLDYTEQLLAYINDHYNGYE